MRRVEVEVNNKRYAFEFPETLTGRATYIGPGRGPDGNRGEYEFEAELLREFLRDWIGHSTIPSDNR